MNLFEVTGLDIEKLNAEQLTDVLARLVAHEAKRVGIPQRCIDVSSNIDAPDGGIDCEIRCDEQFSPPSWFCDWIPGSLSGFQCKATDMSPADCKKEMLRFRSSDLKPRVECLLDDGGTYVLFYGRRCNSCSQERRVSKMREAVRDAGKTYHGSASLLVYDADKIARWANEHLAVITMVMEYAGRPVPGQFKSWKRWRADWEDSPEYVDDDVTRAHIIELREHLVKPRAVARIVGLSGLGKSRLAFETCRPIKGDDTDTALCDKAAYVDCEELECSSKLLTAIDQWQRVGAEGLIIVDNCDSYMHERLQDRISRSDSRISILTIDYGPRPRWVDCSLGYPLIELEPTSKEVIRSILSQSYELMPDRDVDRIAEFSCGFPEMAVLLAKARLNDASTIGMLNDDALVQRLVWGRDRPEETGEKVIAALSLFDRVGFRNSYRPEVEFVAKSICRVDINEFLTVMRKFRNRGIVQYSGRFAKVTPQPLAVRLAADWWENTPLEIISRIISEMPSGMLEAFCTQMAKLHFVEQAHDIVSELCGECGPFGNAEALNTVAGARLFSAMAEVNPSAASAELDRIFGSWNREQLLCIGPGRRHLVYALEKLCFWENTFDIASRLMLSFAEAETESWANNSTSQFIQLYQVVLSGTQAPPEQRLRVIDEALASQLYKRRELAVKALGRALQGTYLSRIGGVEAQGSRPTAVDWYPQTTHQIREYWSGSLQRLVNVAMSQDDMRDLAKAEIGQNIRSLCRAGMADEVANAIMDIHRVDPSIWMSAINGLRTTLRYEGERLSNADRLRLQACIDMLVGASIENRLTALVSVPPFGDTYKDSSGNLINAATEKAKALANELCKSGGEWVNCLGILLQGEQREGYAFGYSLGQCIEDPWSFLTAALRALGGLDPQSANLIVLGGFLAGLRTRYVEPVREMLNAIGSSKSLVSYLPELTRRSNPEAEDLERLLKALESGAISVNELHAFASGSVLDHLECDTVIDFCEGLMGEGLDGASVALHVLYIYCCNDAQRLNACAGKFRSVLMLEGLLESSLLEGYSWQQVALMLLRFTDPDTELAKHLSEEIINASANLDIELLCDYGIIEVLRQLLLTYARVVWPLFGQALLSEDYRVRRSLEHLFGVHSYSSRPPLILDVPEEILFAWCAETEGAASAVAGMIPLFDPAEPHGTETVNWTHIAQRLIDEFGTDNNVLRAVEANMYLGTFSGSLVPYYQRNISAMRQIEYHVLPEVRRWACACIGHHERLLKVEKSKDEEEALGSW